VRVLAIAAALVASGAAARTTVTLTAKTHAPTINTHWSYVVRASRAHKPVAARLTVQLVDPLGGVHAVQFGANTKNVKNWPFHGVFRDYVIFPRSSRGVPLTFRVTVSGRGFRKVISYRVTPRG
jgi:hypothetical protein